MKKSDISSKNLNTNQNVSTSNKEKEDEIKQTEVKRPWNESTKVRHSGSVKKEEVIGYSVCPGIY